MSLLQHIYINKINLEVYTRFFIGVNHVGWVHNDNISIIQSYPNFFEILNDKVMLNKELDSFNKRTYSINSVMKELYRLGIVKVWRNEPIPVLESFGSKPLMLIDRGAALFFGIELYGVFLNGYTIINNNLHMWVAKRSKNNKAYPNKYDSLVGGGISGKLSPWETLQKEAYEEAGITKSTISKAKSVGTISYIKDNGEKCLESATAFNFDIFLPNTFKPKIIDGEVESFKLWSIERVKNEVEGSNNFKDNTNLTMIDFFIRHGVIDTNYPDYTIIARGLQKII